MKALVFEAYGEPWDVIRLVDRPQPALRPGTVLVSLEAAPVHIADLIAMRGQHGFLRFPPGVPGFEGVGRITACGPDVSGWTAGDRVFLPIGFGTWQESTLVEVGRLTRAPENVAAEQLALMPINLVTAYVLLFAYAPLGAGDWVIQNAANSNVGTYVAAIAADRGINLINVVRRADLLEALKAEGRAHVLLDGPDLPERVRALTHTPPLVALDAVGGEATSRLGACLADHAEVLAYGFLSRQAHRIDYPDLMFRGVRLRGLMTNWGVDRLSADEQGKMRDYLMQMASTGRVTARIAGVYPFSRAADALRHAAETGNARTGKIILMPDL